MNRSAPHTPRTAPERGFDVARRLRELADMEPDSKRAEMIRKKAELHEEGARGMELAGHR